MKTYTKGLITLFAMLFSACILVACATTSGTTECEKNGHIEAIDQAVAATCTKTGLTEGKHCSVCNQTLVAQTETPMDPNAHTYQNGICTGCKKLQTEGLHYRLECDLAYDFYEVTGIGTCTDTEIYIPAEYEGLPVKSIRDCAFYRCEQLTSITTPDSSVTSIGKEAFSGCSSLTSVTIGNGVTSIAYAVFSDCSSLTSVTIGNSVTSVADYAFSGCSNLTSINIPDNVTSIGNRAFSCCSSLTSITIPNSVTSIEKEAFSDCNSLTSVTIGNGVTSIADSVFSGCSSLTSVTIPDSVTSIDSSAFSGCSKLNYNTYGDAKYLGNEQNPYVALIKVTDIFITSCEIHSQTKVIADCAFSYCINLPNITIPESVTNIGKEAFSGCSSLTCIGFTGTQSQWDAIEKGKNWQYRNVRVICTG